ncbi:hypothetical protein QAD02_023442 [Eretmocerus hayati]|uniref:Uncharacterized protein n=1 Tax=Eretmocerus hayati TaxID=131215 RepID=A0ACC2PWZ9_9HYME|nr:hypothetical protein QAD02_023442 [Eretmocerus hayati]
MVAQKGKKQVDLDPAIELLTYYREQGPNRDLDVPGRIAQMLTSAFPMLKELERARRSRTRAKIELNMLSEDDRQQKIQKQRADDRRIGRGPAPRACKDARAAQHRPRAATPGACHWKANPD